MNEYKVVLVFRKYEEFWRFCFSECREFKLGCAESCAREVAGTQWDAWVNQSYDRKVTVYGIIRKWTLECIEEDVTWTNSLVNYFETIAQNGSAVAFTSNETVREISSTSVYVLAVEFGLSALGDNNIRKFTLNLQKA